MLEQETILKLISLLCYIGFFISSITGLVELGNDYNICMLMTSIVVMLCSMIMTVIEILPDFLIFHQKQIYYFRSMIIIHYSLLTIGLTSVGIGFGIWGILVGITNFISGIFYEDVSVAIHPEPSRTQIVPQDEVVIDGE